MGKEASSREDSSDKLSIEDEMEVDVVEEERSESEKDENSSSVQSILSEGM